MPEQIEERIPMIGRFLGGLLVAFGWLAGVICDDYSRGAWQILVGLMTAYAFGWRPEVRHRLDRMITVTEEEGTDG